MHEIVQSCAMISSRGQVQIPGKNTKGNRCSVGRFDHLSYA